MPALEMCVLRTASFFLLIVQEAAIPLCDWSTTTADSYPSIIPIVVDV